MHEPPPPSAATKSTPERATIAPEWAIDEICANYSITISTKESLDLRALYGPLDRVENGRDVLQTWLEANIEKRSLRRQVQIIVNHSALAFFGLRDKTTSVVQRG